MGSLACSLGERLLLCRPPRPYTLISAAHACVGDLALSLSGSRPDRLSRARPNFPVRSSRKSLLLLPVCNLLPSPHFLGARPRVLFFRRRRRLPPENEKALLDNDWIGTGGPGKTQRTRAVCAFVSPVTILEGKRTDCPTSSSSPSPGSRSLLLHGKDDHRLSDGFSEGR